MLRLAVETVLAGAAVTYHASAELSGRDFAALSEFGARERRLFA
jgi:hypothetical protein